MSKNYMEMKSSLSQKDLRYLQAVSPALSSVWGKETKFSHSRDTLKLQNQKYWKWHRVISINYS